MISESKKLLFKTVFIVLDGEALKKAVVSGKYSAITAISYDLLSLPDFRVRTKTTALISLTGSEDDIFKKFNDTTRNEIRKSERTEGLKIISDDKNFDGAYSLYSDFEYSRGEAPFSKKALKECIVFSAYYNNEIVSGIFVDLGKPYLRVRYIFSKRLDIDDKEAYKIVSNSTRRLIWEICLWGKKNGFVSLDMASVNFKDPEVAGITKFKMSFGGDVVNEYTYIYKSAAFRYFEKLAYFKIIILRFLYSIKKIFHGK
jgi:lipid II:glycine glycyltransferase (peptidoglycan interpeptide bridge formation enzyme)